MKIDGKQLARKPKKIGNWGRKPVYQAFTKGGYHIIVDSEGTTLGVGPHAAVARHIALEHAPDINFTEISKSDYVPPEMYADYLPKYREVTARLRQLRGK